jgi:hypothetical protein
MATSNFSSDITGWVAIATGIAGLLALAFIILFFSVGQPFGTLNDICIAITAILSGVLAWMLYPEYHAQAPLLSQVALVVVWIGTLVVTAGSVLVIFGVTGWFLAGLYMAAGNALIGLWFLGLNYSAYIRNSLPHSIVIFGLVIGGIMALGLAAIPGILARIDAWDSAPWYVNYIGQAGALGWLVLYPIWCILLGRGLLHPMQVVIGRSLPLR